MIPTGDRSTSPRSPSLLPSRAAGQEQAADCSTAFWTWQREGRAADTGTPSLSSWECNYRGFVLLLLLQKQLIQAGCAALPLKTRCGEQGRGPSMTRCPRSIPAAARRAVKGSDPALLSTAGAAPSLPGFHATLFACPDTTYRSGWSLAHSSVPPARCHLLRAWITPLTKGAGIPARLLLEDRICFGFGGCLTSRRDACNSRVALYQPSVTRDKTQMPYTDARCRSSETLRAEDRGLLRGVCSSHPHAAWGAGQERGAQVPS